jgi:LAS superfamily LD-carboxypeptidase LdcB
MYENFVFFFPDTSSNSLKIAPRIFKFFSLSQEKIETNSLYTLISEEAYSFLVNETHLLPYNYKPQRLVHVPFTAENILVEKTLAKYLELLIHFIDGQNEITVMSGYRDYFEQERLY